MGKFQSSPPRSASPSSLRDCWDSDGNDDEVPPIGAQFSQMNINSLEVPPPPSKFGSKSESIAISREISNWSSPSPVKSAQPDCNRFLKAILSLPVTQDKNYDEQLIVNQLSSSGFGSVPTELPLSHDSFRADYKRAYLPLLFLDKWAQLAKDATAEENDDKRTNMQYQMSVYEVEEVWDEDFITLHLRAMIPSTGQAQLFGEQFMIQGYIASVQVENKETLGFVQKWEKLKSKRGEPAIKTEGLPVLGEGGLVPVEFVVQIPKSPSNLNLVSNLSTVTLKPIHYYRPALRHLESLCLMERKPGFSCTFLKPELAAFELDTNQPTAFQFIDEQTFNVQQKAAIVSCYNAVQLPPATQKTLMIQGPPGTGKSHTLVGIVKNLFANLANTSTSPFRILICAPSNGAIDEIAIRLDHVQGLQIVRLGREAVTHEDVRHLMIDNWLSSNPNCDRKQILQKAHVIVSTLNSCHGLGMEQFREGERLVEPFRAVIVDEASQCTEPELLMPLVYPTSKLILIGDHKQLPATVISQRAQKAHYGRSLFERLYKHFDTSLHRSPVLTLVRQFRMHEQVAQFPSAHFYSNKLETPFNTGHNPRLSAHLEPYTVFDLRNSSESTSKQTGSKYNRAEADFIFKLVLAILDKLGYYQTKEFPRHKGPPISKRILILPEKLPFTLGIITFYRGQKEELTRKFRAFYPKLVNLLDINTVDSFQGQERDIVILSCVRAFDPKENTSVGFVKSEQRMNVALTRAKAAMFVCINGQSFREVAHWKDLLKDAEDRKRMVSLNAEISCETIVKKIGVQQLAENQEESEQEDRCPVCLKKFTRAIPLAILSRCGHVLCRECISSCEGSSVTDGRVLTCPLCRQMSESFMPYASGG